MNRKHNKSKNEGFSAFWVIALPFFVLGITTANPAFFGVAIVFLIMAISEGSKKGQDKDVAAPDEHEEA